MVTMSEVAAKAGVSQATVSFVLGGRADGFKISQRTRERVLGAAHELGYQRNQLARAVVTGKSRIIGILTAPNSTDNIIRIMTGAMQVASQQNYLLKVVPMSYEGIDEATIASCLEWRLAGVIVVGFSEETHHILNDVFRKNKIPVTAIDNVPPVSWGARIASDDEMGIGQAVSHLINQGHRKIAFIGGRGGPMSEWRASSFRKAMGAAGLSAPMHWVRDSSWGDQAVIEAQVKALFDESGADLPTAIVCSSDSIAMVVYRIARSRGLNVPRDLSVTGYSNASLSDFLDPPLTTVDQSFPSLGGAAALQVIEFAERKNDDPHEAKVTLLPTQFIERGSTAPPPSFQEITTK